MSKLTTIKNNESFLTLCSINYKFRARSANITDEDLVPNDNSDHSTGPRSTANNGASSLLATQSRNMDASGNYSDFLNSNGNLSMAPNQQSVPAMDPTEARREAPGFWDLKENEDHYVPMEEQRILRTVPQFPEHIDRKLEEFNKLDNQGPQNLYGAQVSACQSLYN